jgi:putative sigma-54 modulation protein
MQIHLSPRNVRLTAAIHSYVAEKIMRLEDVGGEILAAHVVLVHDEQAAAGAYFCVKVHLAVPGPDIHASETDGDLYAAIDKVSDKVAMQLRKKKKRVVDRRRKATAKGLLTTMVTLALLAASGGNALAAMKTHATNSIAGACNSSNAFTTTQHPTP